MKYLNNRSYVDPTKCGKIYICAAKSDVDLINMISADIFESYKEDIIISFREDVEIANSSSFGSSFQYSLKEAQLVIAIITPNFVNQREDDGSLREFKYAINNDIPVLPIAMERGLEDVFNDKCGKLELIFHDSSIYYELFKEALHNVLLDSDMKSIVRKYFRGKIFISYRRQDLKRTKKLIDTIHKVDEFKDVGIWYDGELVPGKDYENEIFSQLSECKVAVMLITPKLLEQGNFIMNEYPRVKKMGIKILPYLAEYVDINEIKKYYDGIFDEYPEGITNTKELISILLEFFENHNETFDPEKLYYLGLANQYGIDFSIDCDKAIEYFRKSAKEDYEPAIMKLIELFESGDYKNTAQFIDCQKRYISILMEKTERPCKKQNVLVQEQLKLGNALSELGEFEEAISVLKATFDFFDLNPSYEQNFEYYMVLSRIHRDLGNVYKRYDKYDESRRMFILAEKASDDAERVSINEEEKTAVRFYYSTVAESIAMTILEKGEDEEIDLASSYIQIAIKPYESVLYSDTFSNDQRREVCRLYYEEGLIEEKKSEIMQKCGSSNQDLLEQLDWTICVLKNAYEYCIDSDYQDCIKDVEAYRQLTLIYEALKNMYWFKFLIEHSSDNLSKYEDYLIKMMGIFTNVNQDKTAHNALIQKVNECISMGEFFAKRNYKDKAIEFYKLALNGLRGAGFSEIGKDIKTIKRIIKQLS